MHIGDTLKKAAGLFVEIPADSPGTLDFSSTRPDPLADPIPATAPRPVVKTVEDVVRDQPGPNLDEIKPAADPAQPVIDATGSVNFGEIYRLANLPATPLTAEQVLEVLNSLPAELPLASKRATVKVTIDAMSKTVSCSPESIVADASRKLAALAAYSKSYADQAEQFSSLSQAEIEKLQAQIEARKAAIEDAKKRQDQMAASCTAESNRLDDVLEFFTLDVGASRHAPGAG